MGEPEGDEVGEARLVARGELPIEALPASVPLNHISPETLTYERPVLAIGDLTSIEVTSRDGNGDWGGRVTDMAFIGTTGTARVDGDTVRTSFGLYSDWFTITVAPRQTGQARE